MKQLNGKRKLILLSLALSFLVPIAASAVDLKEIKDAAETAGFSTTEHLSDLVIQAVRIILIFVGGVAVLFILVGGFQYIIARGNEEAMEKAKKTLFGAIIGFVLALLAYTIVQGIKNLIV